MKDMGKLERNGVGSQREMVPKVLAQFERKVRPFYESVMKQECVTDTFSEYFETLLYNFQ